MVLRAEPLAFRQAVRRLGHHPVQAIAAVLILGLGLGLTAASESIIYGLYHRALPFPAADRLVRVEQIEGHETGMSAVSYDDFRAWIEGQGSFEELVAWYPVGVAARAGGGAAERYSTAYTTPNVFRALGVRPVLGRPFEPGDAAAGSAPVAIIGDGLWRGAFAGDLRVIGKLLWIHGRPFTVVGVMAQGFSFPAAQKLWLPLTPAARHEMEGLPLQVFGRLKPGMSAGAAAAQLQTILSRRLARVGGGRAGVRALVSPYGARYADAELRSAHVRMLVGVLGLLLIACVNVASLLLGRTIPRAVELATRAALGAARRRLFAEAMVEPLLLAGGGAVIAAVIAYLATQGYARHHESTRLAWEVVRFDGQSFAFILAAAAGTALLAGIVPALLASVPRDLRATLQEGSPGGHGRRLERLLRWLLAVQVALSCGLLIATGLTVKSLIHVLAINPGFPTDHLLTTDVSVYRTERLSEAEGTRQIREIARQAATLPGVRAAAFADSYPMPGPAETEEPRPFSPDTPERSGAGAVERLAFVKMVSPGYFEVLGLRVVAGRTFTAFDNEHGAPVAVVTESVAHHFFGGAAAVGHRVRFTKGWYEIVGVVADSLLGGIGADPHRPGVYLSLLQFPRFYATDAHLILRTSGPPVEPVTELKKVVARANPDAELFDIASMEERLAAASQTYRITSLLFLVLGASAFMIVMAGIYGVSALGAASRRFEISVRLAMGAQARQILYLLVFGEAVPLSLGIVAGSVLAFFLSRSLRSVLFKVESWDPAVVAVVVAATLLCGLLASLVPARWALGVAPVEVMRRGG